MRNAERVLAIGEEMKEKIYLTDDMVILNFDLAYPESRSDLLKSKEFKAFVAHYLEYLRERDHRLYDWAVRDMSEKNAVSEPNVRNSNHAALIFSFFRSVSSFSFLFFI